MKWMENGDRLR